MTNGYFSPTTVSKYTTARASVPNNTETKTEAAFDKLPTEANIKQGKITYAVDTGAADAYVVSLPHAPSAYGDGLLVDVKIGAGNTNTGPCVINVNTLGDVAIKNYAGSDPEAGDLPAGSVIPMRHNGTNFRIIGSPYGAAAATAADVILTHADVVLTHADVISAQAILDAFNDNYLGAKAAAPTLDNSGNPLTDGDLYFNTTSNIMFVYDLGTTTWLATTSASNVSGPASATDSALALFDGTTGKLLKDSTYPITAAGAALLDDANAAAQRATLGLGDAAVSTVASIKSIEQNSQSAAYTTVLTDAGKHIYHPSADTTARIWTIDSNANVAYPIGTAITFINDTSGGVITIAITSDTLVLSPDGTTGSRTLAANGSATAIKVTSTRWIISGSGLT